MDERIGPRAWQERYAHPCSWRQDFAPLAMPEMFARSARAHADRPLADFLGRRFTYRQIEREARDFARGLQVLGLAKGDRVGLFLPNVPVYLSAYFGALQAGATVVNFSPLYSAVELEAQVADSGTRLLVTLDVPALLPTAEKVWRETALEWLVVARLDRMLHFWQGLALRTVLRRRRSPLPRESRALGWDEVLHPGALAPVAIDPMRDLALLQYTGGTTGRPKGAMLTHQNLTANARQIEAVDPHAHNRDPQWRDVIMGVLPFFHVFANACVVNRTVHDGGMIAMLPRFRAEQTLATLARVRATAMPGVPTMYQALMASPAFARTDFSSLTTCISGGAQLPPPVKAHFDAVAGANLVEGYGLTEAAGVVCCNPFAGHGKGGSIGQPLPGTDLRLLDKDDCRCAAPAGEPGELAVCGPQVMLGYWNCPEAAAEAFVDIDGRRWLRTGDVASIDADGYVRVVDRLKDMIVNGGFKVFPSQLEAALLAHPAVREAMVLGVADPYHGEVPRAYAVLADGAKVDAQAIAAWLNARLGKHEQVDAVVIRKSLPKTMVGKLDRKAMRQELQELQGLSGIAPDAVPPARAKAAAL